MDVSIRLDRVDARTLHAAFRRGDAPLVHRDGLALLRADRGFRERFRELLADAPFEAFFWETPPVTHDGAGRPFELVLVDAPMLAGVAPDPGAFAARFAEGEDVVAFGNLGGDALLVAPCPRAELAAYAHVAAFARGAPREQVHALLERTAREVESRLGDRPLWLSTSGAGVAWLHVRLDRRPKYYTHQPYRSAP